MNISSYPGTDVAGLFFFCRAEILNSGGFVQKYSDQGVSCKNIGQLNHLENLQRYYEIMACPMGAMFIERKSNGPLNHKIEGNTMYYMISCKFSEFPFELCRKRAFNRAKKALFWSRAKILPSGYHA